MTYSGKCLKMLVFALALKFGSTAHAEVALSMNLNVNPTFNIDSNGNQTYTAAVMNTGNVNASSPTVTFVLPADDIPIAPSLSGRCTFTPGSISLIATCTGDPIPPNGTSSFVVVVHPTNTTRKDVDASAISASGGSASASVSSDIIEVAITDMTVTLDDSPDPAQIGLPLIYTLTGLNIQDDTATEVAVTLTLPHKVQVISMPAACRRLGRLVICLAGTLNPGESASFSITVVPRITGWLYASAGVSAATPDPSFANNSAAVRTWVNQ